MILTVDIGNTSIKIGGWDNNKLSFVASLEPNPLRTDDEYAIKLLEIFRLYECNRNQFDGAIVSSVVPALSPVLTSSIARTIGLERIYQVSPGLKTGLNIKIENPASLGSDIVCAAVAAISKYPMPCIIISLGTAATIFALNKKGEMIGGAVTPGPRISLEALSSKAAQLPHIGLEKPGDLIGINTVDSMKSGVIYGWACLLDGMTNRMRRELGGEGSIVVYGGHAPVIIDHCENEMIKDDNLVLEGLKIIYYRNVRPVKPPKIEGRV